MLVALIASIAAPVLSRVSRDRKEPVVIVGGYTANALEVLDVKKFCARPELSACKDWCERNINNSRITDLDSSFRKTASDVWCSGLLMEDFDNVRALDSTDFAKAFPVKHFPWQNLPVSVESGLPLLREALRQMGFSFYALTYDWRRAPGEWGHDLRRAVKLALDLCEGGANPVTLVSDSYGNVYSHMLLAVYAKELVDSNCIKRWEMISPANGGGGGNYVRQLVAPMQDKWFFGPALYALGFDTAQKANQLYGRMCSKWGAHQQLMLIDPEARVEDFHSIALDGKNFENVSEGLIALADVAEISMRENLLAAVAQLAAPPSIVAPEVDRVLRGSNFYKFSAVRKPEIEIGVTLARTSPFLENIGTIRLRTPSLEYDADNNVMLWGDGEIPYYAQDIINRLWNGSHELRFKIYYNQTHGGILTDPRAIRDLTAAILEPRAGVLSSDSRQKWTGAPLSSERSIDILKSHPSPHVRLSGHYGNTAFV